MTDLAEFEGSWRRSGRRCVRATTDHRALLLAVDGLMSGLGDQKTAERCCKPPNPRARQGTSTGRSAPNRNYAQRGDPEVLAARSYSERWASYLLSTAPMLSVTQSGEKFSMQFDRPEPSAGLGRASVSRAIPTKPTSDTTTRPTTCER